MSWPTVEDRLQAISAVLEYAGSPSVEIAAGYRSEKIDVADFRASALGPTPVSRDSALDVYLGDTLGDADAPIFTLCVSFDFGAKAARRSSALR